MGWFWLLPLLCLTLLPDLWMARGRSRWFRIYQALRFLLGLGYAGLATYFGLLDHTFSALFVSSAWLVVLWLVVDCWMLLQVKGDIPWPYPIMTVLLLGTWLYMGIVYPMTIKQDMYAIVHATEKNTRLEETDIAHIPTVPLEFARYKGEKLLGQLANASFYQMGDYSIQKIGGELYWVAPFEYHGFFKYLNAGSVPGYVKISAERKDDPAEIVDDQRMEVVPSAYFGHNLQRKVRYAYPRAIIMGVSFEPDDSGKPYYIVALGHYDRYRFGKVVDSAVIVDPADGSMKRYTLDQVPAFVDQVIPASVADAYNEFQGKYRHGFWNALIGKRDVHVPTGWDTGEEVIGVFGPDRRMYWFTDHTTPDNVSTSMVGYSLMDARSGKYTYYTGSRGFANGEAALAAVKNTFKREAWSGTNPVLYNIYGQDTWYVPVIDANGLLREIALVNAQNPQVVAHAADKQAAFNQYKFKLATEMNGGRAVPTDVSNVKEITGTVRRVSMESTDGGTVVMLLLDGSGNIFNVNATNAPYAVFVREGDRVKLTYADTDETVVSVQQIVNETLGR